MILGKIDYLCNAQHVSLVGENGVEMLIKCFKKQEKILGPQLAGLILLTQCIQLWKEYCNYILQSNNNCISIIYDKFYSDVQYRREIFDILKINYNEKYVNEINGWGKTFFDLKANTTKNQDIFKRYLNFKNDKKFIDYVFKDIELIELWNKICEKFKINKDKQLIKIIYKYIAQ